jgi:hypothetical protein
MKNGLLIWFIEMGKSQIFIGILGASLQPLHLTACPDARQLFVIYLFCKSL